MTVDPNRDHDYHDERDIQKIISMLEEMVIKPGYDANIGVGAGDYAFGDIRIPSKNVCGFVNLLRSLSQEPARDELIEFARFTQKFWKEGQEIMRKHNLCIDDLDNPMQKLAFTFYTDLCEIDSKARHLFQEAYGEENYHDERLPAGVTYSPEHDSSVRVATLDEMIKLSKMIESEETELWERAGRPKNDGYINGAHSGYGHALRDVRRWIDQIKIAAVYMQNKQ